jgi:hypothetical protein
MSRDIMTTPIKIGRQKDCDIVIADLSVSRIHAELTVLADGRISLADCGSKQGTAVSSGNKPFSSISQAWITSQDQVRFGRVTMRVADLLAKLAQSNGRGQRIINTQGPKIRCDCGAIKTLGDTCDVCGYI